MKTKYLKTVIYYLHMMVNLNKDIQLISQEGEAIYQRRQEELELDNFNLLYVALTRAEEQLYIITDKNLNKSGEENTRFYSGIFISFLKEKGIKSVVDYHKLQPSYSPSESLIQF